MRTELALRRHKFNKNINTHKHDLTKYTIHLKRRIKKERKNKKKMEEKNVGTTKNIINNKERVVSESLQTEKELI